ncbi:FAD binding domain-containing protein [Lentinula aciculospora]|uniref:FAD binding domain-containing protein n=1 Tax=Lentinula aciculospora TaxID=153920 RepID=A0A9W8ZYH5_9AGAR|nr:FAD binding domain-containing protein [Lentinula aciculospora]
MPLQTNINGKFTNIDVLIVGAGPAGLMCAYALCRAGINVKIIEKRATRVAVGHADGLQPRTLEVFQSYGLLDRAREEGNELRTAAFYNPNPNRKGEIELSERVPFFKPGVLNPRYDFGITLHQGSIEQIFIDNMRAMGLEVDRNTIPLALEISESLVADSDTYPIKMMIQNVASTEKEIVNAKYVVGADGAHSWVRQSLKIAVDGSLTPYVWGVLDMVPETDFPDYRNWAAVHSDNGTCMIVPRERDLIRVYVLLEGQNAVKATKKVADDIREKVPPEWILDVARKNLHPYTIATPKSFEWSSLYTIAQGVASRYSVQDRIFIAGDACHTHSPKAGQGMNASLNDTYNLAWKLIWVLRGWANPSLLQTYEFERRQYALDLIAFDKKLARLFSDSPRNQTNVDGASRTEFMSLVQQSTGFSSGIGVHYSPSSIVDIKNQDIANGIIIGKRMPPGTVIRLLDFCPIHVHDLLPSDTRFKLLVFTGDISGTSQLGKLPQLAARIDHLRSMLPSLTPNGVGQSGLKALTIMNSRKDPALFKKLPLTLRSHWSQVFVDDIDVSSSGKISGNVYQEYGIGLNGAVVVVRPDGYVGAISSFPDFGHIENYFAAFLRGP